MSIPEIKVGECVDLLRQEGVPEQCHLFDEDSVTAIRAAIGAGRPLLVRGEPGVGKTQLAAAAAKVLRRPLVSRVVDSRTESRDLLWEFDSVQRLAQAQLIGTLRMIDWGSAGPNETANSAGDEIARREHEVERLLAPINFIRPGLLWWAFDWNGAAEQARLTKSRVPETGPDADSSNGVVVLIDEIDKAESDVPNGLLEALGQLQFDVFGRKQPVKVKNKPPLVIITTNEERSLPAAFVRRCLVLHLDLPTDETELVERLVERARAHFKATSLAKEAASELDEVLRSAAALLIADRRKCEEEGLKPLPGQAEFLDLVRAVRALHPGGHAKQLAALQEVARFVVIKHGETVQ